MLTKTTECNDMMKCKSSPVETRGPFQISTEAEPRLASLASWHGRPKPIDKPCLTYNKGEKEREKEFRLQTMHRLDYLSLNRSVSSGALRKCHPIKLRTRCSVDPWSLVRLIFNLSCCGDIMEVLCLTLNSEWYHPEKRIWTEKGNYRHTSTRTVRPEKSGNLTYKPPLSSHLLQATSLPGASK